MHPADTLLLDALRDAPRRFQLPPLPPDAAAAQASGPEGAMAFALEEARVAFEAGAPPAASVRALFTSALAALARAALAPEGGDAAFQAQLLRGRDAQVDEFVRLAARLNGDRRIVRAAVDALAHPGRLHGTAPGTLRDALAMLHQQAAGGAWTEVRRAAGRLPADAAPDAAWRDRRDALLASPSLQRLERFDALLQAPAVQQYQALCEQNGPLAGSAAAAAQGRASKRLGGAAEQDTVQAFVAVAALLDGAAPDRGRHRVVRSLRTPPGFPGAQRNAKDEWDAAIVRDRGGAGVEVVLLAEVKAAPAAAPADLPRLLGGLRRLAEAADGVAYGFPSSDGEVLLAGASLRQLQPAGSALPAHVIYACPAADEARLPMLSQAARAVLLAEPASLAFAQRLQQDDAADERELAPVWDALPTAPSLRAALRQRATARQASEAMLHPRDLLAAVQRAEARTRPIDS